MMKKIFKGILVFVLLLVVLAGIAAAVIAIRGIPKYTPQKLAIKVDYTPQRLATGTKLASMLCRSCHYNDNTHKFTGNEIKDASTLGKIYSKNITNHPTSGIGKWSDGELIYFIRTGVMPDGQYVPPYMPKLIHLSDEDLYSIITFLRSDNVWVQADPTIQPVSRPSFLAKFLCNIGAFKPFAFPKEPVPGPDTTDQVRLGKYITLYQLECYACHSKDFAKNNYEIPERSLGFFGGGNKLNNKEGNPIYSLNLSPDENNGIGKWDEGDFVKALRSGILPGNQPALRYPMMPYSNLTDKEAKAIYSYLRTVPKQNNHVDRKLDENR